MWETYFCLVGLVEPNHLRRCVNRMGWPSLHVRDVLEALEEEVQPATCPQYWHTCSSISSASRST